MSIILIWHIIQWLLVSIEVFFLFIYAYFILEIRRAEKLSNIRVPIGWLHIMTFNVIFILGSIISIVFLRVTL